MPSAAAQGVVDAPQEAFLQVSRLLSGRSVLDPEHAARLYAALSEDAPEFAADVQSLLAWIGERKVEPVDLQRALDAEQSPLAGLPSKIVKAWYTGVVGEDERARAITFETSLMHQVVSDRLNPPSYCNGSYGSWADPPA